MFFRQDAVNGKQEGKRRLSPALAFGLGRPGEPGGGVLLARGVGRACEPSAEDPTHPAAEGASESRLQ